MTRQRKELTEPILLKDFHAWLKGKALNTPSSCLLGKAVGYTLNQWEKLIRYLEASFITLDNNGAENAIRSFVIGRKNWLFSGSPRGLMPLAEYIR